MAEMPWYHHHLASAEVFDYIITTMVEAELTAESISISQFRTNGECEISACERSNARSRKTHIKQRDKARQNVKIRIANVKKPIAVRSSVTKNNTDCSNLESTQQTSCQQYHLS